MRCSHIKVKASHIRDGDPGDENNCAIALAITEATGKICSVGLFDTELEDGRRINNDWWTVLQIQLFDWAGFMFPFQLRIPSSWLEKTEEKATSVEPKIYSMPIVKFILPQKQEELV